jgi:TetR/AcrR family transcriptional regulator, regulator of cefoperazone and chloramphenicol sensitivity
MPPAAVNTTPTTTTTAAAAAVEDARSRLLDVGLRLFAQQGYSKTSTRELAEAASVNVASISYYFGDKAGLYRAVFFGPKGSPEEDVARFNGEQLTLAQALRGFYDGFLEPLKQGDSARLCMKLHFREMLEPTGLWSHPSAHGLRPLHEALLRVLCRHLGLEQADEDLQRLAICLAGLGVHMHVGRDITDQLVPSLNTGEEAVDRWAERLTLFGLAMVQAEINRRATTPTPLDR